MTDEEILAALQHSSIIAEAPPAEQEPLPFDIAGIERELELRRQREEKRKQFGPAVSKVFASVQAELELAQRTTDTAPRSRTLDEQAAAASSQSLDHTNGSVVASETTTLPRGAARLPRHRRSRSARRLIARGRCAKPGPRYTMPPHTTMDAAGCRMGAA